LFDVEGLLTTAGTLLLKQNIATVVAAAIHNLSRAGMIIAAEGYILNQEWLEEHFNELDPVVARRMIKGKDIRASGYLQNSFALKRLRAKANNSLKEVDALLVPTTPISAQPVAEVDTTMDNYLERNAFYLHNTCIGNVLNMYVVSIPCGFTKDGFPIGLLIYGKPFQENVVLRAGYSFQQVTDWHRRFPDLSWVTDA
jgi:Asp-tRNA(Asn)/Glu-tRNA(Gln) amidotransferase A subunit family amidase